MSVYRLIGTGNGTEAVAVDVPSISKMLLCNNEMEGNGMKARWFVSQSILKEGPLHHTYRMGHGYGTSIIVDDTDPVSSLRHAEGSPSTDLAPLPGI